MEFMCSKNTSNIKYCLTIKLCIGIFKVNQRGNKIGNKNKLFYFYFRNQETQNWTFSVIFQIILHRSTS